MPWHFNPRAFAGAILLFVLLVLLATVGAHWGWLRSFGGDVLAVIWVYLLFKTVLNAKPWKLGLAAFGVGCLVELGQYVASTLHWHIGNRMLRIVLGSTADWLDVLAYAIGFALVMVGETLWHQGRSTAGMRAAIVPARLDR